MRGFARGTQRPAAVHPLGRTGGCASVRPLCDFDVCGLTLTVVYVRESRTVESYDGHRVPSFVTARPTAPLSRHVSEDGSRHAASDPRTARLRFGHRRLLDPRDASALPDSIGAGSRTDRGGRTRARCTRGTRRSPHADRGPRTYGVGGTRGQAPHGHALPHTRASRRCHGGTGTGRTAGGGALAALLNERAARRCSGSGFCVLRSGVLRSGVLRSAFRVQPLPVTSGFALPVPPACAFGRRCGPTPRARVLGQSAATTTVLTALSCRHC
jgi:hypothetical protein